jgi:hypothetical protein
MTNKISFFTESEFKYEIGDSLISIGSMVKNSPYAFITFHIYDDFKVSILHCMYSYDKRTEEAVKEYKI